MCAGDAPLGAAGLTPAELRDLAERWREPIRQLCARMTGDAHLGEDLAQETFRRLLRRPEALDPARGRPATFLWQVAVNLCRDEQRRRKVRGGAAGARAMAGACVAGGDRAEELPAHAAMRNEEGALVRQAVMQLPEEYRAVLLLRHFHQLKLREIAEVLEIPEGTVSSRLAEAVVRLTALLKPLFGQPRRHGAGPIQE